MQIHPSIPRLKIIVQKGTDTPTSSTQSLSTTSLPSFDVSSTMAHNQPKTRPWTNPGVVVMPAPLSQLPTHPKKWFPKFNPDIGILEEEHINNFMLSINLNGVTEEDVVVRVFPYTLQGAAGSWYFSLPPGSINSWDAFQEQFLTKFGDNRSTMTLINDLSNLKSKLKEPVKDFNSRFNKLLNKIPAISNPSEEV